MREIDYFEISRANDLQALESALVRFANALGFGIISGVCVVEDEQQDVKTVHFGNTPAAFTASFTSTAVGNRDPVLRRLKCRSDPFTYDQAMYVDADAADLWDAQAPFGYKTGIAVAMHLSKGRHFALGVDRQERLPSDDASTQRMMADLQLVAIHTHECAGSLLDPNDPSRLPELSRREVEILKWTADGKTAWEIAMILGISESWADKAFRGAMAKLGCVSKMQAVVKAVRRGLI